MTIQMIWMKDSFDPVRVMRATTCAATSVSMRTRRVERLCQELPVSWHTGHPRGTVIYQDTFKDGHMVRNDLVVDVESMLDCMREVAGPRSNLEQRFAL